MPQRPSPNFGPRRGGLTPSIVVIHYTAMKNAQDALDRLCDPAAEVSAHYLIANDGTLTQLVAEEQRAWHAGHGEWRGEADVNSRSIGIELDNTGSHPFSEPQMAALEMLLERVLSRWSIRPDNVIAHSDMAPGRKYDPGARFDWTRLARGGLARMPRVAPMAAPCVVSPSAFRALAAAAGYTAQVDDDTLLGAVRLRYRPFASGPLSFEDFAVLR